MFCKNCGAEMPDRSRFCANCGTQVDVQIESQQYNNTNNNFNDQSIQKNDVKKNMLSKITTNKYLIILLIVFVIIFFILFIFLSNKNKSDYRMIKEKSGYEYFVNKEGQRIFGQWLDYKKHYYYIDLNGDIVRNQWIDGYFLTQDGTMLANDWWLDNNTNLWYYVDNNGAVVKNSIVNIDGKDYYFKEDGVLVVSNFFISPYDNTKYMYADENGVVCKSEDFVDINGATYYIDKNGYVVMDGWITKNGYSYYLSIDGTLAKNMWLAATYYVDAEGKMLVNCKSPEGYDIGPDGKVDDKYKVFLIGNVDDNTVYSMGYSIIEGTVSALTGSTNTQFINNAQVDFYKNDDPTIKVGTTTTDATGKYRYFLPSGSYKVLISAPGYENIESTQTLSDNQTTYTELSQLFVTQTGGLGTAGGILNNALDGQGVSGATIRLRNSWNNTTGDYVQGVVTTTDASGRYAFSNLPVGYYTAEASKNNYITQYKNIAVLSNNPINSFDFSINPEMPNDGNIRVVLNWDLNPRDLDSHLIGRKPSGNYFDVYYSDKVYNYNGTAMANLDVDDTDGKGPETETITSDINGVYVYGVHDFTNGSSTTSSALSYSNCRVSLYAGRNIIAEYRIPTGRIGTFWEVFRIDESGQVYPINSIYNYNPNSKDYSRFNIAERCNPKYSSRENTSTSTSQSSSAQSGSSTSTSGFSFGANLVRTEEYEYDDDTVKVTIREPQIEGGNAEERENINSCIKDAVQDIFDKCDSVISSQNNCPKKITFDAPILEYCNSSELSIKFTAVMTFKDRDINDKNLQYTFKYYRNNEDYTIY